MFNALPILGMLDQTINLRPTARALSEVNGGRADEEEGNGRLVSVSFKLITDENYF